MFSPSATATSRASASSLPGEAEGEGKKRNKVHRLRQRCPQEALSLAVPVDDERRLSPVFWPRGPAGGAACRPRGFICENGIDIISSRGLLPSLPSWFWRRLDAAVSHHGSVLMVLALPGH